MRILFITFVLCITTFNIVSAQDVPGCMDPLANNYMPSATVNNGSCTYNSANGTLINKGELPSALREISGMVHLDGKLYAINDGGNSNDIYVVDTLTRRIEKTITLDGTSNVDWEDLTTDGTYIYIGDFGNNANGARTNLRFYRVPVQSINNISGSAGVIPRSEIDTINFRYEDQSDPPTPVGPNTTAYDCEAVLYHNGKLHLFTKNWNDYHTSHYIVSAVPGTYVATKEGSFDAGQILITGATKANDNIVILLGYSDEFPAPCVVWMISGFTTMDELFTTGNKRRIGLGSAVSDGQLEGITAVKQTRVLISNEYFDPPLFDEVAQTLYGLNTDEWTSNYLLPFDIMNFTSRVIDHTVTLTWEYNQPGEVYFEVESADQTNGVYQSVGKISISNNRSVQYQYVDKSRLVATRRFYRIKIISPDGRFHYSQTLGVADIGNTQFNLTVAPNPFSNKLNISFFSDKIQTIQFIIMDMQGRTILLKPMQCTTGSYNFAMDGLQGLSRGVYFLKADVSGNSYVRKIVR
ncbi:MAG: T9SS type A sorting domain-containing protein [Chitinophagaceae bacterium]|nr:T9SS type A sorting domain-containing protein [Chitinophagaceae bacterium]